MPDSHGVTFQDAYKQSFIKKGKKIQTFKWVEVREDPDVTNARNVQEPRYWGSVERCDLENHLRELEDQTKPADRLN